MYHKDNTWLCKVDEFSSGSGSGELLKIAANVKRKKLSETRNKLVSILRRNRSEPAWCASARDRITEVNEALFGERERCASLAEQANLPGLATTIRIGEVPLRKGGDNE